MEILKLGRGRAPEVVDVLVEAFYDYPVMRFVVGSHADYDAAIRLLVGLFVAARDFRGEPMIGIEGGSGLEAVAILSRPEGGPVPEALRALGENVWAELGAPARARYEAFGRTCAHFQVDAPHLHLNMLGVRPRAQRTGLARKLIDRVHETSRHDERSVGVTLTTEDPSNVPLYQHLGYDIIGHAVVAPELRTWAFFRADDGGAVV